MYLTVVCLCHSFIKTPVPGYPKVPEYMLKHSLLEYLYDHIILMLHR